MHGDAAGPTLQQTPRSDHLGNGLPLAKILTVDRVWSTSPDALIRVPFLPNLQAQSAGWSGVSSEALELRNPFQTSVGH